jgi:environmental stress-induced protein Ves
MLDQDTAPFSVPADVPVVARLVDGQITDLIVMTRRGAWRHEVRRCRMQAGETLALNAVAEPTIVLCQNGAVEADDGAGASLLTSGSTLLIQDDAGGWMLRAAESTTAFVIEINRADR